MVTHGSFTAMLWFILDEKNNVVPCRDSREWGEWLENSSKTGRRFVAQDYEHGMKVSTVFLGIDMGGYLPQVAEREPLVFETMVFVKGDMGHDVYMDRYPSWEEAVKGHNKALEWSRPMKHPSTIYDDNSWQHPHYEGSDDHIFVIIHVAEDKFWSEAREIWLLHWQQARTYTAEEAREFSSDKPHEGRWYAIGQRILLED